MADGDVRLDAEYQFPDGARVVIFAVENAEYPGCVNYRFAYLDAVSGRNLLRYDNSRVPRHGVGVHHRHRGTVVTHVPFDGLESHVARFWREVNEIRAERG